MGIMFRKECKYCTSASYLHQLQWIANIKSWRSFGLLLNSWVHITSLHLCFHHSSEWYSVPAKAGFDGAVEKQLWARQDLEVGCVSFFPPQCECIIVWAATVRNDNRGWHWKVPEFSCLKMSLGWLWQNATQGEKTGYDKTTTLKCYRLSLSLSLSSITHNLPFGVISSKAYRQEGNSVSLITFFTMFWDFT